MAYNLCTNNDCLQGEGASVFDAAEANIIDLFITKYWGMKFATSAACTVLRVDQVCAGIKVLFMT